MSNEKIIVNKDQILEDIDPQDREAEKLLNEEARSIKREKFDFISARRVLDKLIKEGSIHGNDTLDDVIKVIEKEFNRIEDI